MALLDNQSGLGGSALYVDVEDGSEHVLETVLVAGNGNAVDEVSVIEAQGNAELDMNSLTVAGNFGRAIEMTDTQTTVSLTGSIVHQNSVGPQVIPGIPFTRSCNNVQTTNGTSQSMGGNLGNPAFESTVRGDYHLAEFSVSRDRCASGPLRDLDGLFRPGQSVQHDQGAFEREGALSLPDAIFDDGFED